MRNIQKILWLMQRTEWQIFEKLCACMIKNRILVYSKWLTDIGHRMADAVDETMLVRMMEEYYQEFLTEKTEVFDFELAGKSMDIYHVAWEEAYGCILKTLPAAVPGGKLSAYGVFR